MSQGPDSSTRNFKLRQTRQSAEHAEVMFLPVVLDLLESSSNDGEAPSAAPLADARAELAACRERVIATRERMRELDSKLAAAREKQTRGARQLAEVATDDEERIAAVLEQNQRDFAVASVQIARLADERKAVADTVLPAEVDAELNALAALLLVARANLEQRIPEMHAALVADVERALAPLADRFVTLVRARIAHDQLRSSLLHAFPELENAIIFGLPAFRRRPDIFNTFAFVADEQAVVDSMLPPISNAPAWASAVLRSRT